MLGNSWVAPLTVLHSGCSQRQGGIALCAYAPTIPGSRISPLGFGQLAECQGSGLVLLITGTGDSKITFV